MKKNKKIIAAIVASTMIATATPATASAAPVQTPIGTVQVPDNIMQTIGPILAAVGGLASIAAIIGTIFGSSNGSSLSSDFIPSTPGNNTTKPNNPGNTTKPSKNPKPSENPKPSDPNITQYGGPKSTSLSASQIRSLERQVFDQINYERQSIGRHPLAWRDNLYTSAKNNSADMARRGDINHKSFAGGSEASEYLDSYPLDEIGVESVNVWSGSPGHWNILMSDYSYYGAVGITPTVNEKGESVYVVVFQGY